MSSASSKNNRLEVGILCFTVFPDGTYRWLMSSGVVCWRPEWDQEWRENLSALKSLKPLFPEDAKKLADAQAWLDGFDDSEGGDE